MNHSALASHDLSFVFIIDDINTTLDEQLQLFFIAGTGIRINQFHLADLHSFECKHPVQQQKGCNPRRPIFSLDSPLRVGGS